MNIATFILGAIALVCLLFSVMIISYMAGRKSAIKEITDKIMPFLTQFQEALKGKGDVSEDSNK